jgi:hypothetical protein
VSTVSIHCPNCGANNVSEEDLDQYVCDSCGTHFQFTRPKDGKVVHVTQDRYCPICGTSTSQGKGHRCTRCKTIDLCSDCVDKSPDKLFCKDCLKEIQRDCIICGKFAEYSCNSCKNIFSEKKEKDFHPTRTCEEHQDEFYDKIITLDDGDEVAVTFRCPNCDGICPDCAWLDEGFLRSKLVCRYCDAKVREVRRYVD